MLRKELSISESRYKELPADRWVSNRRAENLTMAFFNAGGQTGTPRRPDGTLDPAQEAGGWIGFYAPDAETAEKWRAAEMASIRNAQAFRPLQR